MTPLTTKAAEIRAGLEGVTPGPWTAHLPEGGAWSVDADHLQETVCRVEPWSPEQDEKDAAHIARLDPATVLAFLDERDQHLALIEQQAAELAEANRLFEATLESSNMFLAKIAEMAEENRTAESERDELLREKERLGKLSDRYGVALMMIRAGCSQPQRFAGNILDDKEPVEIDLEDCDEDHR